MTDTSLTAASASFCGVLRARCSRVIGKTRNRSPRAAEFEVADYHDAAVDPYFWGRDGVNRESHRLIVKSCVAGGSQIGMAAAMAVPEPAKPGAGEMFRY